ncbi:hypothetical protein [Aeromicrobium sp. UC242_57]|uniref:hypothetical protein n=1 Tax=Aeromicrobium sp. UC242_57 TaxID=3374624 RepID=UPI0037B1C23C
MAALSALTIAVFVVLVLVDQDVLSEGWAYSMLPIGVVAVVVMGLVTVFKAVGEEKGQAERGRDQ